MHEAPVCATLDHDEDQTDAEEHGGRRGFRQPEATITEQREGRLERRERRDGDEADDGEAAKDRRCRGNQAAMCRAIAGVVRLRKANHRSNCVDRGQHAGDVEGHMRPAQRGKPADGRA